MDRKLVNRTAANMTVPLSAKRVSILLNIRKHTEIAYPATRDPRVSAALGNCKEYP